MFKRVLLFLCLTLVARADSPVTSTVFWQAYQDIPEVQRANDTKALDDKLIGFLLGDHPIDQKAALLNALSWDGRAKPRNFVVLRERLGAKYQTHPDEVDDKLTAEDAFCLGYVNALDMYSSPSFALPLLRKARQSMPRSFTVAMLTSIVEAQEVYDQWEKIWPIVVKPTKKKDLIMDMRPQAKEAIFEYLRGYQEYAR